MFSLISGVRQFATGERLNSKDILAAVGIFIPTEHGMQ
jgi:hypothetical protein